MQKKIHIIFKLLKWIPLSQLLHSNAFKPNAIVLWLCVDLEVEGKEVDEETVKAVGSFEVIVLTGAANLEERSITAFEDIVLSGVWRKSPCSAQSKDISSKLVFHLSMLALKKMRQVKRLRLLELIKKWLN